MLCYPSRASTTYRYPLSAMADALRADPVPTVSVASSTLPYLAPYPAPYPAPHPAPYLTPYRGALTAHPSPTLALTPSIKPSWRRPTELVPLTYRSTAIIDGGQTAVHQIAQIPPGVPAWACPGCGAASIASSAETADDGAGSAATGTATCPVCLDDLDGTQDEVGCGAGHHFHQGCLAEYLRVEIDDGRVHNLGCPLGPSAGDCQVLHCTTYCRYRRLHARTL